MFLAPNCIRPWDTSWFSNMMRTGLRLSILDILLLGFTSI